MQLTVQEEQKPWTGEQVNLRKSWFMLLHGLYILVFSLLTNVVTSFNKCFFTGQCCCSVITELISSWFEQKKLPAYQNKKNIMGNYWLCFGPLTSRQIQIYSSLFKDQRKSESCPQIFRSISYKVSLLSSKQMMRVKKSINTGYDETIEEGRKQTQRQRQDTWGNMAPWQASRSVFLRSTGHTNSGIAVHHAFPSKCTLTGISFLCEQWMRPSDRSKSIKTLNLICRLLLFYLNVNKMTTPRVE